MILHLFGAMTKLPDIRLPLLRQIPERNTLQIYLKQASSEKCILYKIDCNVTMPGPLRPLDGRLAGYADPVLSFTKYYQRTTVFHVFLGWMLPAGSMGLSEGALRCRDINR